MHKAIRICLAGMAMTPCVAMGQEAPSLSFYGTSGLIDMPTGFAQPDGQLSTTISHFGPTSKYTLTFQIAPRLSGSFRYSIISDFDAGGQSRYDRSFDLRYQLLEETAYQPAVSVGIQDFGGTGVLAAEYLVASKHFTPRFSGTVGIGWGRYGTYNGFTNPLGILNDGFETRPANGGGINTTGRLDFDQWFRGDAALFAGVQWQATDKLTLTAEYSSDDYSAEESRGLLTHKSPLNFGASYQFENGWTLGGYYLYGSEFGVNLTYGFNPKTPSYPGGREESPEPISPRNALAAASWGDTWQQEPRREQQLKDVLAAELKNEGLRLDGFDLTPTSATVLLRNRRFDASGQAVGRTARVMANTLPPSVETFVIVPVEKGQPQSKITLKRDDLEELEFALDGAWKSYVRADIEDAADVSVEAIEGLYPRLSYGVKPYFRPSLFDPDNPLRADFGAQFDLSYTPRPGLIFSGSLRQPIIGNLDEVTRTSNSVLPRVRSDSGLYEVQSELELSYLTTEYFFRPGANLYGRVTAGYLERMYGGISGEVLWKPVTGPWAFGVELNYVKQRDFDLGLGFQSYDIVTGHASAYYEFGDGYLAQVDVGRYLAGDWGATFALDREFANGVRVGAYFTLTDVPFSDFGEGSFDKGIRITIPTSVLSGEPTKSGFSTSISPVTRDGGARLNVRNRLYGLTRDYHDPELAKSWGKFWR
ncbi:hypothetical protein ATO10_11020 [Actibacterium atlanticum]|uniref:Lipoprotein n=1 Tax=Actibacterium atlanticum TaxID=1461693 RepID=A0A058ZJZ1_9RHOB|nr:YjbH domain-containing protein [Actibacterium atlanticum]KCV81873.1 hypothetical protein ATO10_11020 [Actibacterium atlanticum]